MRGTYIFHIWKMEMTGASRNFHLWETVVTVTSKDEKLKETVTRGAKQR